MPRSRPRRPALVPAFDLEELEEVIAVPYLRVSKDESGRTRSNTEQLEDAESATARKRTWKLSPAYEDVGSASKHKTKERAGFDRLMEELGDGSFPGHVLILWEASRGSRAAGEWAAFLDALEARGVFVFVTSLHRVFNPRVAYDWKGLMDMGVQSEFEIRQQRERSGRAGARDVRDGAWNGGRRPFGFTATMGHHPEEAPIVRELIARALGGASVRSLAADLNARGITTSAGNAWHPGPLADLLRAPRNAGLAIHYGETIGKAKWDPIISKLEHKRVVRLLASRSPVGRRGRAPWLLTGLLRCGTCGQPLVGNTSAGSGTRRYVCRRGPGYAENCGGLGIKAEPLEAMLGDLTGNMLDAMVERRAAAGEAGDEEAALETRLAEIPAERDELSVLKRTKAISAETWLAEARGLDAEQAAINAKLARVTKRAANIDIIAAQGGRPWGRLSRDEQRGRIEAAFEFVRILPASTRGSRAFEQARVVPHPHGEEEAA